MSAGERVGWMANTQDARLRGAGFFLTPRHLYLSYLVGREPLEGFSARSYTLDWR